MLAQAVTGTPGRINSMTLSVGHFLERFPVDTMREGDCYLTNDPWKGTGHLNNFTVVSPSHRKGKLVALFACTSHEQIREDVRSELVSREAAERDYGVVIETATADRPRTTGRGRA